MTPPDRGRRRTLLLLGSGMTLLAGCGDTDPTTPEPAPPPNGTADTPTEALGPGPEGEESPTDTETRQGTGTPVVDDVVFSKPGGGEVPATRYGRGDCGVVLVPQIDADRQSWDRYARRLADAGYAALAIDEGENRKAAGVTAAVGYLHEKAGVGSVVLIGASSGGEAAVRAAARNPDAVAGVVALSAAGGADVADQLEMPSLFVVSEGDAREYVNASRTLADRAAGDSELVTYEGEAHGQHLFRSPYADALRSQIGDFLARVCGGAEATPTETTA